MLSIVLTVISIALLVFVVTAGMWTINPNALLSNGDQHQVQAARLAISAAVAEQQMLMGITPQSLNELSDEGFLRADAGVGPALPWKSLAWNTDELVFNDEGVFACFGGSTEESETLKRVELYVNSNAETAYLSGECFEKTAPLSDQIWVTQRVN